jgi:Flp pilus assembly protein TadD
MIPMSSAFRLAVLAFSAALLAACASSPLIQSASLTRATPEQMVAQIRASAGDDDSELAVQPLRDPMAEDLREEAAKLEREKRYADAAAALDKALQIAPDDPATLQERAEGALLMGNPAQAETLARRGFEKGAKVGPLCRRHWATIEQARLVAGDAAGAQSARTQLGTCKVAALERF